MAEHVLVIAPHPDDETLGCGGTILNYRERDITVSWLIMTTPGERLKWSSYQLHQRKQEINLVAERYGFESTFCSSL